MFFAAGIVASGGLGLIPRTMTALALALALVIDTADGRLARLQGTSSPFGRWLDHVLDELSDITLHAAIAWSMFQPGRHAGWLVVGILYASGKYIFLVQSVAGAELVEESRREKELLVEPGASPARREPGARAVSARVAYARGPLPRNPRVCSGVRNASENRPSLWYPLLTMLRQLASALGHADVRWHLWIFLSLLGRLDLALALYAVYFPLRALAGGLRKAVAYA
jgi:hypothetical protein